MSSTNLVQDPVAFKEPGRVEIVKELEKYTCGGTINVKKAHLTTLNDNRETIKRMIGQVDAELADLFNQILPTVASIGKRTMRGKEVAEIYFDLSEIYGKFTKKVNQDGARVLRSTEEHMKACFFPFEDAGRIAGTNAFTAIAESSKACIVVLSTDEAKRSFLRNGTVPSDPALRACLVCSHRLVDQPNSNADAIRLNEEKWEEYAEKLREHEERKKRNEPNLKQAPTKPAGVKTYFQCHCAQASCTRNATRATCPLCNGGKQQFDEKGQCTCPICKCQCQVAYKTNAHAIVQLDILKSSVANNQRKKRMNTEAAAASATTLANIMQRQIESSLAAARPSVGGNFATEKFLGSEKNDVYQRMLEGAGRTVAQQFGGDSEHQHFLKAMGGGLGMPSTNVTLNDGKQFDTRSLSSSMSSHRLSNNDLDADIAKAIQLSTEDEKARVESQNLLYPHGMDLNPMNLKPPARDSSSPPSFNGHVVPPSVTGPTAARVNDTVPPRLVPVGATALPTAMHISPDVAKVLFQVPPATSSPVSIGLGSGSAFASAVSSISGPNGSPIPVAFWAPAVLPQGTGRQPVQDIAAPSDKDMLRRVQQRALKNSRTVPVTDLETGEVVMENKDLKSLKLFRKLVDKQNEQTNLTIIGNITELKPNVKSGEVLATYGDVMGISLD